MTACIATIDSLPTPVKAWRPVPAGQITATWLVVAIAEMVDARKRRKAASNSENIQEQPA